MPKRFFCFSLKTGAFVMFLVNIISACVLFYFGLNELFSWQYCFKNEFYYIHILSCGFVISALFLLYGICKAVPLCVFLYLTLSSTCLFIFTVAILIISPMFLVILAIFWYGQICVNSFYKDLVDSKSEFTAVITTFNGDIAIIQATVV